MKYNFYLYFFLVIFCAFLVSCSSISSKISNSELALNPEKKEVLNEMNGFLDKFTTFNANGLSEFYSPNALIDVVMGRYTPESFEERYVRDFKKFKKIGMHFGFEIQSLDIVGDKAFLKGLHQSYFKKRKIKALRWFVWKKIDGKWKIVSHTSYPPEYISEEDRIKYGL